MCVKHFGVCKMLGIQNQLPVNHNNRVNFTAKKPWEEDNKNVTTEDKPDSFDKQEENKDVESDEKDSNSVNDENKETNKPEMSEKERLQKERDEQKQKIDDMKQGWEDFADELEKTDNKAVSKMGKGARFIASAAGVAGTFVLSKYSSKLTIETLKSFAKSKTMQSTTETITSMKKPLEETWKGIKKIVDNPKVKAKIDALKNSKIGKATNDFLNNEKVKKVTEPIKNTIDSIKDSKINGEKLQSAAENTMAATATGSVIVDNLTGRNDDKSAMELATGS